MSVHRLPTWNVDALILEALGSLSRLHTLAGYTERDRITSRERAAWERLDIAQSRSRRLAAERRDLERGCQR